MIRSRALEQALAGKYKGTTVTVGGAWAEAAANDYRSSLLSFEEKTSIDVQYWPVNEDDNSLTTSIEAGQGPDVVEFDCSDKETAARTCSYAKKDGRPADKPARNTGAAGQEHRRQRPGYRLEPSARGDHGVVGGVWSHSSGR